MNTEEYLKDEKTEFVVTNDNVADWAIKKIKDEVNERDRLISIAENQIAELKDKISKIKENCENSTSFLKSKLDEYFDKVEHKSTKTQESYALLSGKLVKKYGGNKAVYEDEKLIEWLKNTAPEYIKTIEKPQWGEYKKRINMIDGKAIDTETGEIVDCIVVEKTPDTFDVKF